MEFDYPSWARWGIGSSVTFDSAGYFMEVTATLLECDADKAVLRIDSRLRAPRDNHREMTFTETLPARPPLERRHTSFFPAWDRGSPARPNAPRQFSLSSVKPSDSILAEGDEILEIAGEDWMTHWVEKPGKHLDHEVRLRFWRSETVPGGLVKLQVWTSPEDISPFTWSVKSFERRP